MSSTNDMAVSASATRSQQAKTHNEGRPGGRDGNGSQWLGGASRSPLHGFCHVSSPSETATMGSLCPGPITTTTVPSRGAVLIGFQPIVVPLGGHGERAYQALVLSA